MKKIKSITAGLIVAIASMGMTAFSAQAVLIDNGNSTIDTETGLEWLDLTQSTNISVNDILGGVGGFAGAGYIHATRSQISGFVSSLGDPTPFFDSVIFFTQTSADPLAPANATALVGFLGATDNGSLLGFFDDGNLGLTTEQRIACINAPIEVCRSAINQTNHLISVRSSADSDFASPQFGHWLNRTASVPEPGTLALFGLGLAGIGVVRRKKVA